MDESEAGERSRRLLRNVERASDLLAEVGETHWGDWIDAVFRELFAHNAHGLNHLLSGYGGMGSFNDLAVHPMNGHSVPDHEVGVVNDELRRLRSEMYDDASALLHDLNRSD